MQCSYFGVTVSYGRITCFRVMNREPWDYLPLTSPLNRLKNKHTVI